jgi:hypothetical protein
MTRDKFLKQLADQEKREGSSEDIELLRKLVNSINSARLLMMLVKVDFVRYGTQCYRTNYGP